MDQNIQLGGYFSFKCYDKNGNLKWTDENHNLVVNVGLQKILDDLFTGSTQVNPWYIGLTDGTPTVNAADTMASHSGWAEVTAYSETTRQEYVDVRSAQTVSNSASVAVFTANATATVGGGFIASSSTKSETASTLLCAVAFSAGDRTLQSGDTLNVTYTFTAASS